MNITGMVPQGIKLRSEADNPYETPAESAETIVTSPAVHSPLHPPWRADFTAGSRQISPRPVTPPQGQKRPILFPKPSQHRSYKVTSLWNYIKAKSVFNSNGQSPDKLCVGSKLFPATVAVQPRKRLSLLLLFFFFVFLPTMAQMTRYKQGESKNCQSTFLGSKEILP